MKVIITYASAGAGHLKAAEAIYSCFRKTRPEIEVQLVDILNKANPLFRFVYNRGYTFLINHSPRLWSILFGATSIRFLRPVINPVVSFLTDLSTLSFVDYLIKENADYIISCHFSTSEIVSDLKAIHKIKSQLVTVITDFGVHPLWIAPHTDLYTVASSRTKEELTGKGIPEAKIKDFGIPIHAKFSLEYNRVALVGKFNLKPEKFTVLVVTGSFGTGPLEEIVNLFQDEDIQILVVCARNQRLYQRLKEKNYPHCLPFGFVDNIEELMAVSDMIITKPGGLSISESLAMGLLPVFISPIPGQETENIRVLSEYGVGIYLKNLQEIKKIVLDFKAHPDKLKEKKEIIAKIKKPFAARDICHVVC